ncbi:MAG: hypothetical protein J0G35_11260 [Acidobacteriales bacterium]|nr:hypothetical protein [Terriglobales bacterium]
MPTGTTLAKRPESSSEYQLQLPVDGEKIDTPSLTAVLVPATLIPSLPNCCVTFVTGKFC